MKSLGLQDNRPDRILTSDDAAYLALECGLDPVVNDALAFDIYPDPPPVDKSHLPLRPPVVCIMGHVDHGKTTLLDALRSSSIAQGEAGGITQHIGAFEVSLSDLTKHESRLKPSEGPQTITFLDTPGHAAFSAMRSRGAMSTDVAVIVVAGDDGVKPQTKEVIELVRQSDVGVIVAITKCDKPGLDLHKTRAGIYQAGLEIEGLGGEVPCVEVSALTGKGLSELTETIVAVAEIRDLRAEADGVRFEGRVIESDVGRGRGNVATVISFRGKLHVGLDLVAGRSYGRARQLIAVSGLPVESVSPGRPVQVTGWKILPEAGSLVLGADSEEDAKRAYQNRVQRYEELGLMQEIEVVNEKRATAKEAFETHKSEMEGLSRRARVAYARERERQASEQAKADEMLLGNTPQVLKVVVKADYTGTVEAVTTALEGLGNKEISVKVVSSGVGNVSESDVSMAVATDAMIVGFNVSIDKSSYHSIATHKIECQVESVIYRLVEHIEAKLVSMLPKLYENRVAGQALIAEIFEINVKGQSGGRKTRRIAGCKVTHGEIVKKNKVRVIRDQETIWEGSLEQLKHGKKDENVIRKGTDCGIMFKEDEPIDFRVNDLVQSIETFEVERKLH